MINFLLCITSHGLLTYSQACLRTVLQRKQPYHLGEHEDVISKWWFWSGFWQPFLCLAWGDFMKRFMYILKSKEGERMRAGQKYTWILTNKQKNYKITSNCPSLQLRKKNQSRNEHAVLVNSENKQILKWVLFIDLFEF